MNINVVTLVGRVGGDPDMKYVESGGVKYKLCKLTLAVRRRSRNNDEPDWFALELWDRNAEVASNYVRKGSLIGIKGSLRFDFWSDRNTGAPRSTPIIRVEQLDLLGSRKDAEAAMMDGNPDYF